MRTGERYRRKADLFVDGGKTMDTKPTLQLLVIVDGEKEYYPCLSPGLLRRLLGALSKESVSVAWWTGFDLMVVFSRF